MAAMTRRARRARRAATRMEGKGRVVAALHLRIQTRYMLALHATAVRPGGSAPARMGVIDKAAVGPGASAVAGKKTAKTACVRWPRGTRRRMTRRRWPTIHVRLTAPPTRGRRGELSRCTAASTALPHSGASLTARRAL